MMNGNVTTALGSADVVVTPSFDFRIVREVPAVLIPQMREAVKNFMEDSQMDTGVERKGFFEATLEALAGATYLGTLGHELWIGTKGDELYAYALANITREVDNRLTYWVYQAYVRKDQRGKRWVKDMWQKMRNHAKKTLCSHVVVVSSRNDDAYCRFLGKGWRHYASLLREDI